MQKQNISHVNQLTWVQVGQCQHSSLVMQAAPGKENYSFHVFHDQYTLFYITLYQ